MRSFRAHMSRVVCVAMSGDGRRVASGSYDKSVPVWDVETGAQVGGTFYIYIYNKTKTPPRDYRAQLQRFTNVSGGKRPSHFATDTASFMIATR